MIRQTRQRLAIEGVFRSEGRPLTVAELHEAAQARAPGTGLRTVYRHIRALTADGKIVGIDYPGQPLRYEWVRDRHHAHFICRVCNRLFDLDVVVPEVEIVAPAGWQVTGQETVFYGCCPQCGDL